MHQIIAPVAGTGGAGLLSKISDLLNLSLNCPGRPRRTASSSQLLIKPFIASKADSSVDKCSSGSTRTSPPSIFTMNASVPHLNRRSIAVIHGVVVFDIVD